MLEFVVQCELEVPYAGLVQLVNATYGENSVIEYSCSMEQDPPAKTIVSANGFALQTTKSVCTISSSGEFIFKAGLFGFKIDSSGFCFMDNGSYYTVNNTFFKQ